VLHQRLFDLFMAVLLVGNIILDPIDNGVFVYSEPALEAKPFSYGGPVVFDGPALPLVAL
jgi:hypothetical protein